MAPPTATASRLFAALLLAAQAGAAAADWSLMGGATDIYSAYADKATITKVDEAGRPTTERGGGDNRSMWALYSFSRTDVSVNGQPHQSTRALHEYDCTSARVRLLSFEDYSEAMGAGRLIASGRAGDAGLPGRWEAVVPGAVDEAFLKAACGRPSGAAGTR